MYVMMKWSRNGSMWVLGGVVHDEVVWEASPDKGERLSLIHALRLIRSGVLGDGCSIIHDSSPLLRREWP